MPLHKTRPFGRKSCAGGPAQPASGTGSLSPTNTDKSNEAAMMAQQLASQASWADTYVPTGTPATTATPPESVADGQSQADTGDAPPSYEDARLERPLPQLPQTTENVRQERPSLSETPAVESSRDVEVGTTTPLLYRDRCAVKKRKIKQRRFIIVFVILAIWLMGIQACKGFAIGFWRSDGTLIPPLPHRNYTRHETSSSITGTFTFYDGLELSTTSGSINIVVDPQSSEKVGVIRLTSRSGSVKLKFTDEYMKAATESGVLDRIFDIEVRTSSGSQTVEMPQGAGGTTSLISSSGSIVAKISITNLGGHQDVTKLSTQSSSGSQTIKIKSTSSEPISSLAANHWAKGSGSIRLGLPSSWTGMVHAASEGSGGVDVKGERLQYQRNGNKEVYAWRVGDGDSKEPKRDGQVIEMKGDGSGSIKVDCNAS